MHLMVRCENKNFSWLRKTSVHTDKHVEKGKMGKINIFLHSLCTRGYAHTYTYIFCLGFFRWGLRCGLIVFLFLITFLQFIYNALFYVYAVFSFLFFVIILFILFVLKIYHFPYIILSCIFNKLNASF